MSSSGVNSANMSFIGMYSLSNGCAGAAKWFCKHNKNNSLYYPMKTGKLTCEATEKGFSNGILI